MKHVFENDEMWIILTEFCCSVICQARKTFNDLSLTRTRVLLSGFKKIKKPRKGVLLVSAIFLQLFKKTIKNVKYGTHNHTYMEGNCHF